MAEQTRYQRWESGLPFTPDIYNERELDLCLMKQTRRVIYQGGYLKFENITYKGENLGIYAGEQVIIRYDPTDITTIFVYQYINSSEIFLARAFAQDLETESLSSSDAKASSNKLRQQGKSITNRSILDEVRHRDEFIARKQKKLLTVEELETIEIKSEDKSEFIEDKAQKMTNIPKPKIYSFSELDDD